MSIYKSLHLVYRISSTFSNDFYIGRKTIKKLSQFKNYWSSSKKWKQFVLENGTTNFTKEILFEFDTEQEQVEKENYLNLDFYKNDLDCWSRGTFTGMVSEVSRKRVEDGTHPFIGGDIQKESNRKRVENGTHNLLGENNPSHKSIAAGTHHFLKNKGKIWVCNSEGSGRIHPDQLDDYLSRGYQKGRCTHKRQ